LQRTEKSRPIRSTKKRVNGPKKNKKGSEKDVGPKEKRQKGGTHIRSETRNDHDKFVSSTKTGGPARSATVPGTISGERVGAGEPMKKRKEKRGGKKHNTSCRGPEKKMCGTHSALRRKKAVLNKKKKKGLRGKTQLTETPDGYAHQFRSMTQGKGSLKH